VLEQDTTVGPWGMVPGAALATVEHPQSCLPGQCRIWSSHPTVPSVTGCSHGFPSAHSLWEGWGLENTFRLVVKAQGALKGALRGTAGPLQAKGVEEVL
jgi:hypothetical protein